MAEKQASVLPTKMFSIFAGPAIAEKEKEAKHKKSELKRKYEKDTRRREFQHSWLKEFTWLDYDKQSNQMTCKICKIFDTSKVGTFISGSNFFRKDSIKAHGLSFSHVLSSKKQAAQENPETTQAAKTLRKLNEKTVAQLCHKFRNVHYLCKKCRPFTDYPELCELNETQGLDIGSTYLTSRYAAVFAEHIAEAERNRIRKDLEKCLFVSVISDGTTDASFTEAEIVYLRKCHQGKISVYFSFVKNVPRGDAETICDVLLEGLSNLCPDYKEKIVGTGTDGASSMLGNKNGAVQRLRDKVNRQYIVGVHCNGHKLELSYKDAAKSKIPLFDKIELLLLNLYYFYRNSNITRSGLRESSKALGRSVVYPTRVGGTRWVGHIRLAISNLIKAYDIFVLHLGQVQ